MSIDTCIVCLSALDGRARTPLTSIPDMVDRAECNGVDQTSTTTSVSALPERQEDSKKSGQLELPGDIKPTLDSKLVVPGPSAGEDAGEPIARLVPCGHCLHDECLKLWINRANSCPICRVNFNVVERVREVKGPAISSYSVKDKRQSVDPDPAWEDYRAAYEQQEDGFFLQDLQQNGECANCDRIDDQPMMECESCGVVAHEFCANFEWVPHEGWICAECERGIRLEVNNRYARRVRSRIVSEDGYAAVVDGEQWNEPFPTFSNGEIVGRELEEWMSNNVVQEQTDVATRSEIARNSRCWRQRIERAQLMSNALEFVPVPATPAPPPNKEALAEIKAWEQLEKAIEPRSEENTRPVDVKLMKRRATDEPDSSPAPERQLKRPRTKRSVTGTTARAGPNPVPVEGMPECHGGSAPSPKLTCTRPLSPPVVDECTPSTMFESLLREVETSPRSPIGDEATVLPRRVAWSPSGGGPMQTPPLSPQARLSSPILLSPCARLTNCDQAPAHPEAKPDEGSLKKAYPLDPPNQRERGTDCACAAHIATDPASSDSDGRKPPLAMSDKYSHKGKTKLAYPIKSKLQNMVRDVIRPMYRSGHMSKGEYTVINRDVSRILYESAEAESANTDLESISFLENMSKQADREVAKMMGERYDMYIAACTIELPTIVPAGKEGQQQEVS